MYRLITTAGAGSTLIEAALELARLPYAVEEIDYAAPGPGQDRLRALNPLGQVPILLLPDGSVMTESAAMILHIADRTQEAGLVPPPDDPARPAFLRWLIFLVAGLYPTFAFGDDPSRWVSDKAAQAELGRNTLEHRQKLWRQVEASIAPAPWFLGSRFSALDLYAGIMTRWRPRRPWFAEHCPKVHAIAVAMDGDPRLAKVWRRNFG